MRSVGAGTLPTPWGGRGGLTLFPGRVDSQEGRWPSEYLNLGETRARTSSVFGCLSPAWETYKYIQIYTHIQAYGDTSVCTYCGITKRLAGRIPHSRRSATWLAQSCGGASPSSSSPSSSKSMTSEGPPRKRLKAGTSGVRSARARLAAMTAAGRRLRHPQEPGPGGQGTEANGL